MHDAGVLGKRTVAGDVERASDTLSGTGSAASPSRVWVERLHLTDFRNYAGLSLTVGPGSRRAHRRQRLGQDQPARGPVAADLRPGPAPRPLSGARAHGGTRLGGCRPAQYPARRRRHRHRPHPSVGRRRSQRTRRAHRWRDAGRLRRARRARRGIVAHPGHGRSLHRARVRAPSLPRSADRRPRPELPQPARPVRARHAAAQPPPG